MIAADREPVAHHTEDQAVRRLLILSVLRRHQPWRRRLRYSARRRTT